MSREQLYSSSDFFTRPPLPVSEWQATNPTGQVNRQADPDVPDEPILRS